MRAKSEDSEPTITTNQERLNRIVAVILAWTIITGLVVNQEKDNTFDLFKSSVFRVAFVMLFTCITVAKVSIANRIEVHKEKKQPIKNQSWEDAFKSLCFQILINFLFFTVFVVAQFTTIELLDLLVARAGYPGPSVLSILLLLPLSVLLVVALGLLFRTCIRAIGNANPALWLMFLEPEEPKS